MNKETKAEILAEIRTLLALDRNYLAEERTFLAQFRSGLALALISAPISTIIAVLFPRVLTESFLALKILVILFFIGATIIGLYMLIRAEIKIRRMRQAMAVLQVHLRNVIKKSAEVEEFFKGLILTSWEFKKSRQYPL